MTTNGLEERFALAKSFPVESWTPSYCGDSRIRICRDCRWFHEGTAITRRELVLLFAKLLRLDTEGYMIVTPAEKLSVSVEDVPFLAVDVDAKGDDLIFTTNVGDSVQLNVDNALRMAGTVPYLHVRHGLEARLSRSVYYQLAAISVEVAGRQGVWSGGRFHVLYPV